MLIKFDLINGIQTVVYVMFEIGGIHEENSRGIGWWQVKREYSTVC